MFLYAKTNLFRVMKTLKYVNALVSAIFGLLFSLISAKVSLSFGLAVNIYFQPRLFAYFSQCVSNHQGQNFPLLGWASFEQLIDRADVGSEVLQVPFWARQLRGFTSDLFRHW